MREEGRGPLGPFALYVLRPSWVGGEPKPGALSDPAWKGVGVHAVPITALKDGMIIFEFDKSESYSGGAVPPFVLPKDRKVPPNITKAEQGRIDLGYNRFVYMNAFLLALYAGIVTKQKAARHLQDPVDPTNYFLARQTEDGWQVHMDLGREINYPGQRADNIEVETFDHTLEILEKCQIAIGSASLDVLSLIYLACSQRSRHQFPSAHLVAWATVEKLLNIMWSNLQDEISDAMRGHTVINKKRRELLEGRDYTASVVSQILSISNKLNDDKLRRLDEARRKRNAFAHNLDAIGADDVSLVILLVTDMISDLAEIRVRPPLSISYWI